MEGKGGGGSRKQTICNNEKSKIGVVVAGGVSNKIKGKKILYFFTFNVVEESIY
jgi:hypothetical protein